MTTHGTITWRLGMAGEAHAVRSLDPRIRYWRTLCAAYVTGPVAQEQGPRCTKCAEAAYLYQERAGIHEFEGGATREDAEEMARGGDE